MSSRTRLDALASCNCTHLRARQQTHTCACAHPPPSLLQCIDQGLTFYWGTSEWSADQIAEAWRIAERLDLIGPGATCFVAACHLLALHQLGRGWVRSGQQQIEEALSITERLGLIGPGGWRGGCWK